MRAFFLSSLLVLLAACSGNTHKQFDTAASWSEVESKARGTTLTMMMFQGDKKVNRYMTEYVVPQLRQRYGITLQIVPGQGKEIVSSLMSEIEAGKEQSELDLCWINGETFFQLRQLDALWGPFTDRMPNNRFVDYRNPVIRYDFQQEVKGYEAPWGESFYYLICDSTRTMQAPHSMREFEQYWSAHPGRFTFSNDFSGMTLLKSWLVEIAGGMAALDGTFNEAKYKAASQKLWAWINAHKQQFWRQGETFPSGITQVAQMFGSGELDFSMSFNDAEIDNKVQEGVFPKTSKAFLLAAGAIRNTHYVGIPARSAQREAAMVVCNFLVSPEAQARKSDIRLWGSRTVLDYATLDAASKAAFDTLPPRRYGLPRTVIEQHSIRELAPEYMLRLFEDFRTQVINAR